jgi:hypothetical protein
LSSGRTPSGRHGEAGALGAASRLDDTTARYVEDEVDAILEGYGDLLPAEDLAWMRERLLESVDDDPALSELASAARPRSVDRSTELPKQALSPSVKKAVRGGRR